MTLDELYLLGSRGPDEKSSNIPGSRELLGRTLVQSPTVLSIADNSMEATGHLAKWYPAARYP